MTSNAIHAMKRSLMVVFATCVSFAMAVCPAFAYAAETQVVSQNPTASAATGTYIIDTTGTFDAATLASLEDQAKAMSESSGIGVYLLYVSDIGTSTVRSFAEAQFNSRNLGLGDDKSGVMFLVARQSRDYVTITHGKGISAFTDKYIESMEDDVVENLKDNKWLPAANAYLADAKKAVSYYAEHGEPYKEPMNIPLAIAISLGAGVIVALLVCKSKADAHKTAKEAVEADNYVTDGSFELKHANDVYQGTAVICIKRHDEDKGGSTVSSSGFGGSSGGKF